MNATRRSKAELQAEYNSTLRLFEVLWSWQKRFLSSPIFKESDPFLRAEKVRESSGISRALSGLQQAVNDCLEMARMAPPAERTQLNEALVAAGLPSLTALDKKARSKVEKALKRGRIRNNEEYYLLVEIVGQVDAPLDDSERGKLDKMIHEYGNHANRD